MIRRILPILIAILLYTSQGWAATFTVGTTCVGGCDYANITAVNADDFDDADILEFQCGESYTDTSLKFTGVTSRSGKTITIQDSCSGVGTLPIIGGNTRNSIYMPTAGGLGLVIKNIDISGQDYNTSTNDWPKIYIVGAGAITIDGVIGDGSTGYNGPYDYYKKPISISSTTGNIEIKNCTLQKWGDSDNWATPATPKRPSPSSPYNQDYNGITIVSSSPSQISIHDNTIHSLEADGIALENSAPTTGLIYSNTIYNCGENSVDIKASQNFSIYQNTFYRSNYTGIGGSSSGEETGNNGLINFINHTAANKSCTNNVAHSNKLGSSDTAAVKFGSSSASHDVYNITFRHNEITGIARFVRLQNGGGMSQDQVYSLAIFGNEVLNSASGDFLKAYNVGKSGSPIEIYNNSYYNANAITDNESSPTANRLVWIGTDVDYIIFKNNAVYINDADAYYVYETSCSAGANSCQFDSNQWFNNSEATGEFYVDAGDYDINGPESEWNDLSGNFTVGTDSEGNPLFTSSTDLRLSSTSSPCYGNADGTYTLLDPDSTFPDGVVTMQDDNIGAYGYEDAPPVSGNVGLYNIYGGAP